jgi:signal transduction histidine kinase/DNA-binding response OmpR family regulator
MASGVKIRVLINYDSEIDRQLLISKIQKLGYDPEYRFTNSKDQLEKFLQNESWDIILSDISLKGYEGLENFQVLPNFAPDPPLIFISESINEKFAAELFKNGENYYPLKQDQDRLGHLLEWTIDDAELRINKKRAEKDRDLYLHIIDSSINEVYILEKKTFRLHFANKAALLNLQYPENIILKLKYSSILTDLSEADLKQILHSINENLNDKITITSFHKRRDSSEYPVKIQFQHYLKDGSEYYIAIVIDQTQLQVNEKKISQLKRAAEELERTSSFKSRFLANITHELRTPLNSILLMSHLLLERNQGDLNSNQLYLLETIHESGTGLMDLIDEVLDMSKIEAGKMVVRKTRTNLNEMIKKIENLFSTIAIERNLTFNLEISNKLPEFILTDRIKTEQILRNLLSNAFKFTNKGFVKLTSKLAESEIDGEQLIEFQIEDSGIGIDPEKQDEIFLSYHQADESIEILHGGTGLGLAISNELANLLGGEITLSSTPGHGSTFIFRMPFVPAKEVSVPSKKEDDIIKSEKKLIQKKQLKKLLIIDDNKLHNEVISELLSDIVDANSTATSASEARNLIKNHDFAGILLDLSLPDVNGLSFLRELKSESETRFLPIIILSGISLPDQKRDEILTLADDFILKSVDSYEKVRNIVSRLVLPTSS